MCFHFAKRMSRILDGKSDEGKTESKFLHLTNLSFEKLNSFLKIASVGPLKWMAPESILHNIYSFKSDTFSFGVVCYEVMSRKEPYVSQERNKQFLL